MGKEGAPKELNQQYISDLAKRIRLLSEDVSRIAETMGNEQIKAIVGRQSKKGQDAIKDLSSYVNLLGDSLGFRLANRSNMSIEQEIEYRSKPQRPDRSTAKEKEQAAIAEVAVARKKKPGKPNLKAKE